MANNVPLYGRDANEHRRQIASGVNGVIDGRQNNIGEFTLTANVASTQVDDRRAGVDSVVTLMPTTGNASLEVGNGTIYIGTTTDGSFTVTHANNAQTDRTFKYEVTG